MFCEVSPTRDPVNRICNRTGRIAYDRLPGKYGFDIICTMCHIRTWMVWVVEIGDEFEPEFDGLHEDVQTEILALSRLLQQFGPQLGRPRVDTLNGSRHANMKELRFSAADGESAS